MKLGIDISHWQSNVDFKKIRDSGKTFCIAKVSQGQRKDSMFDYYYNSGHDLLDFGAYIYNKVLTVEAAKKEADFAIKSLDGKNLPAGVWLDMEDASMRILGKEKLTDIIMTEAEMLKAAGYDVGVYCNLDWFKNVLNGKRLIDYYPFWIARYPSVDNGEIHYNINPNHGCMWQYSSKGKVPGINGNVDLDILHSDFKEVFGSQNIVDEFYPKYEGESKSLITAMQIVKIDSNFNNRRKIAAKNGIVDNELQYKGTEQQNIQLLSLLKAGKLKK